MKRTPLTRKTPLRSKSGLRVGASKLRPRAKAKRAMGKAPARWRSPAYLAWLKGQPCCRCGAPADDPHHAIALDNLSGTGLTAPDSWAMPVCRPCHDLIHRDPELWPLQALWVARTLTAAIQQGVLALVPKDKREAP